MRGNRLVRTAASYVPGRAPAALRALAMALRRGAHHPDYLALRDFRRPNPVVVDASVDLAASISAIRRTLGPAQIHAIEPNPAINADLERRDDVTVPARLLGRSDRSRDVFVPRYGRTSFDTRTTLDETAALMFLGDDNFAAYRPGRASVDTLSVPVTTLDALDLAPDVLLLDTRREATAALHGALGTLGRHLPLIRVNGTDPEAIEAVEHLDYVPARYDTGARCIVLEQPGAESFFLVHPHHQSLIGTSVV